MKKRSIASSVLLAILAITGITLSLVTLYQHTAARYGLSEGASFCNLGGRFNCDVINASEWSMFLGIPLATYGIFFYFLVLALAIMIPAGGIFVAAVLEDVLLVLTTAAVAISLLLFGISEFSIGTLCLLCLGTYLVNLLLFLSAVRVAAQGLVSRMARGLGALVGWLVRFLSPAADRQTRALSLLTVLVLLLLALVGFGLPDVLLNRWIFGVQDTFALRQSSRRAVEAWREATPVDLKLNLAGGVDVDHIRGLPDAPVRIVEFTDFECPACRNFYIELEEILPEFGDKVALVYKNYPLDMSCNRSMSHQMHPHACFAAMFARCAGEQGQFWSAAEFLFTADIFARDRSPKEFEQELLAVSGMLSLDQEALKVCLDSGRHREKIQRDIDEANDLRLSGTPSVWLNGRRVETIDPGSIRAIIESIVGAPAQPEVPLDSTDAKVEEALGTEP